MKNAMQLKRWENYQKYFEYAIDIEFNDTLKALEEIMGLVSGHV